ncbi:hypothetical protein HMI55_005524 [Coelomomyces lativittatus]|nr:hypothetical protein HMI55_005524 [Coelomomyces lativittatus]
MMKAQYAYASEPIPAGDSIHPGQPPSSKKFENKDASGRPVNIMYDKRIYRGNTYAAPIAPLV